MASIDQPIGEDGASLHDVLPAPEQDGDPVAEFERETVRELAELRARLVAADVQPSTSRAVVA